MAASSSTTVNPNNNYHYHVFLNHRGPDVKKTFASYLYRRLLSHGLRVFLDQQELQQGDSLTDQIVGAIRNASLHVAIFSPRYADSNWCLNELLLMLESGATIIPVFYHVRPAELRWTRGKDGKYAQDLQKLEKKKTYDPQTHKKKSRHDPATIEKWRSALSSVADISGFDLEEACNGDEGELLDRVVERVLKKVKKTTLHVAKYPTGLDEKVEDFENEVLLQQQQCGKPPVMGIVGLGGIGKTTLAKELFNRKSSQYSKTCFLSNIRETAQKSSLLSLQSKLIKSLTGSDPRLENIDEGIERLTECLKFYQVFVILDDVDSVNQVDALLPHQNVVRPDSLILITSRNKDVLTSSGVHASSIYKLSGLNIVYSLELFCSYAFNQCYPLPGFEYLVLKFLEACDGLPLSLKVLGALFCGNTNKSYWEDHLDRLQRILPMEIQETLKISYDALGREEKQIFLDIACFFIGESTDRAIRIWDGSGWKGRLGFQNLHNRGLVEVYINRIHMHDHLRDMGRHISETATELLLSRQHQVLTEMRRLRGIKMGRMIHTDSDDDRDGDDIENAFIRSGISLQRGMLQLSHSGYGHLEPILRRVHSPNLIWLVWDNCLCSSLPSWISMKNLRVLQVRGSVLESLWEEESQPPFELRELEIDAPLSSIPKSIGRLKHLQRIFLDVRGNSNLKELPDEFCQLRSLKALVLKQFDQMKHLPECFGNLTNLQYIELYRFHNLERLPDSFGNLNNLQHIDISYSFNLKRLPNSLGNLTNAQHIDMSHCWDLERLPDSFRNLTKLRFLNLYRCCNLTISSELLGNITKLEYLDLSCCEKLEALPRQVAQQRSLESLYLNCSYLKELPLAIGELSELEVLVLGSPLLDTLPPSLGDLRNLKELSFLDCRGLKCLPSSLGLLSQLIVLKIEDCALSELPFKKGKGEKEINLDSSIGKFMPHLLFFEMRETTEILEVSFDQNACPILMHLSILWCSDLLEVGALPSTLIKLDLSGCNNLKKIEGLCGLAKLRELNILMCKEVEELPGLETLLSLEELVACSCEKLKSIWGLAQLTKLRTLQVSDCSVLEEIEGVEHCRSLEKLNISRCPKLQWGEEKVEQLRQQMKDGLVV